MHDSVIRDIQSTPPYRVPCDGLVVSPVDAHRISIIIYINAMYTVNDQYVAQN